MCIQVGALWRPLTFNGMALHVAPRPFNRFVIMVLQEEDIRRCFGKYFTTNMHCFQSSMWIPINFNIGLWFHAFNRGRGSTNLEDYTMVFVYKMPQRLRGIPRCGPGGRSESNISGKCRMEREGYDNHVPTHLYRMIDDWEAKVVAQQLANPRIEWKINHYWLVRNLLVNALLQKKGKWDNAWAFVSTIPLICIVSSQVCEFSLTSAQVSGFTPSIEGEGQGIWRIILWCSRTKCDKGLEEFQGVATGGEVSRT